MTADNRAWSRHFQEAWAEDALNPVYSMPLRVAFLARPA
jgi:hypothetical protein